MTYSCSHTTIFVANDYRQGEPYIMLTLCNLGYFSCFYCCLLNFCQIKVLKNLVGTLSEYPMVLNPDKNRHILDRPDLGPNCLQRLSADTNSCSLQRINTSSKLCTYLLTGESSTNEAVENLSCDCILIS